MESDRVKVMDAMLYEVLIVDSFGECRGRRYYVMLNSSGKDFGWDGFGLIFEEFIVQAGIVINHFMWFVDPFRGNHEWVCADEMSYERATRHKTEKMVYKEEMKKLREREDQRMENIIGMTQEMASTIGGNGVNQCHLCYFLGINYGREGGNPHNASFFE